jgi:hypothetical protein
LSAPAGRDQSLGVIYFSRDWDCKYGGVAAGASRNHRAFLLAE